MKRTKERSKEEAVTLYYKIVKGELGSFSSKIREENDKISRIKTRETKYIPKDRIPVKAPSE